MTKTTVCGLLFLNHKNTKSKKDPTFNSAVFVRRFPNVLGGFGTQERLTAANPLWYVLKFQSIGQSFISAGHRVARHFPGFSVSPILQVAANATGVKRFTFRLILALFARRETVCRYVIHMAQPRPHHKYL